MSIGAAKKIYHKICQKTSPWKAISIEKDLICWSIYAGVDVVDYALYPDKDYQMEWLRTFLELRNKRDGKPTEPVTDAQVEKLYVQTNKFALVSL